MVLKYFFLVFFLLAFTVIAGGAGNEDGLLLVEDGKPRIRIVLAADASEQVELAVEEMQKCIRQASGAEVEITKPSEASEETLHVGSTEYVQSLDLELDGLEEDGFVICRPEPGYMVIAGGSDWGTSFGIYRFLEEFLDVRWLLPGEVGRSVPQRKTIKFPGKTVRENPAFVSRRVSGFRDKEQLQWARRNGMHNSVSYHHNLRNLYKPEMFAEENPRFYPFINHYRFNPLESDKRWQPCFTADGIVEAGAERIGEYFRDKPEAASYSLGINDTLRFCECPECRALDSGRINNAGYPHLSDRYFAWANAVVEKVLKDFPDKRFGMLAYLNIAEAPDDVPVNSHIIPFLTSDRMRWAVSEFAEAEKKITRDWRAKVKPLGWYDYIYGTPYAVPRLYPHLQAEYLRWAYEHDVRYLAAEGYPNFAEGPKLYAWLKLAWDPCRDVDDLLDEWYVRCVGEDAAPALKAYYEHWEDFWTQRVTASDWFDRRGHFLSFYTPGYLNTLTRDDLEKSRSWLKEAVDKAGTDRQRRRAELLKKGFEYYEATARAYPGKYAGNTPADEQEMLEALPRHFEAAEMARKRLKLVEEFADDPVLQHSNPPYKYEALKGDHWHDQWLLPLFFWIQKSDEVRYKFARRAEASEYDEVRKAAEQTEQIADSWRRASLVPNASFERGGEWAAGWTLWIRRGVGKMERSTETSHSGDASIKAYGIEHGSINHRLVLEPGIYAVTAFVREPAGQESEGTVKIALVPADEQGGNMGSGMVSSEISPSSAGWQTVVAKGEIPAVIDSREIASVGVFAIVAGFDDSEAVYIDELRVVRLDSSVPEGY